MSELFRHIDITKHTYLYNIQVLSTYSYRYRYILVCCLSNLINKPPYQWTFKFCRVIKDFFCTGDYDDK